MMIGEHFKRVRNSKNLTQEQMAAGIVNRSFYSRVENGSSSITADNLMKILYKHGLAMTEFLRDCDTSESNIETYQDKITVAYINKDILALKDIYLHFKYEDVRTKRLLKFLISSINSSSISCARSPSHKNVGVPINPARVFIIGLANPAPNLYLSSRL